MHHGGANCLDMGAAQQQLDQLRSHVEPTPARQVAPDDDLGLIHSDALAEVIATTTQPAMAAVCIFALSRLAGGELPASQRTSVALALHRIGALRQQALTAALRRCIVRGGATEPAASTEGGREEEMNSFQGTIDEWFSPENVACDYFGIMAARGAMPSAMRDGPTDVFHAAWLCEHLVLPVARTIEEYVAALTTTHGRVDDVAAVRIAFGASKEGLRVLNDALRSIAGATSISAERRKLVSQAVWSTAGRGISDGTIAFIQSALSGGRSAKKEPRASMDPILGDEEPSSAAWAAVVASTLELLSFAVEHPELPPLGSALGMMRSSSVRAALITAAKRDMTPWSMHRRDSATRDASGLFPSTARLARLKTALRRQGRSAVELDLAAVDPALKVVGVRARAAVERAVSWGHHLCPSAAERDDFVCEFLEEVIFEPLADLVSLCRAPPKIDGSLVNVAAPPAEGDDQHEAPTPAVVSERKRDKVFGFVKAIGRNVAKASMQVATATSHQVVAAVKRVRSLQKPTNQLAVLRESLSQTQIVAIKALAEAQLDAVGAALRDPACRQHGGGGLMMELAELADELKAMLGAPAE